MHQHIELEEIKHNAVVRSKFGFNMRVLPGYCRLAKHVLPAEDSAKPSGGFAANPGRNPGDIGYWIPTCFGLCWS
jgi:hypothetical protein